jgi:hypothetical protein
VSGLQVRLAPWTRRAVRRPLDKLQVIDEQADFRLLRSPQKQKIMTAVLCNNQQPDGNHAGWDAPTHAFRV